jgi:pimeloyl-ACP methyl ester carboxylesterase
MKESWEGFSRLARIGAADLAYDHRSGSEPGVLFLPGFNSDMQGTKALALDRWCSIHGRQFTRFDYSGHGCSGGSFREGTIGQWRDDALAVLDQVATGPQVLVGSSMGGWLMLLVALCRPQRVAGLVGIASAPDFTERMRQQRLGKQQLASLQATGYCELPIDYGEGKPHTIGRRLLDEGRDHLLLDTKIGFEGPVRLLHGQSDEDVPWALSLALMEQLASRDVELTLIKDGDHRLSSDRDIERLLTTVERLLATLGAGIA